jgi:hypothetical protein
MNQVALLVTLQARPGKEAEVEGFLKSALPLVEAEPGTTTWFAFKVRSKMKPDGLLTSTAKLQRRSSLAPRSSLSPLRRFRSPIFWRRNSNIHQ